MIKKILLLYVFIMFFFAGKTQNNVGLLKYDVSNTYEGYTLIYPHNQPSVFLLNNCGQIVHEWIDSSNMRPGNTAYLLSNGNIVKAKRLANVSQDVIWAGGGGMFVEIRSWDNELIWSYELNNENYRLHHDIEVMPNGNILMIVWERKTKEEAIAAGRDSTKINQGSIWSEMVLEVNSTTNEVVWEWHVWDHLIQDFDDSKPNFGVISEHPELIDLNYDTSDGASDWLHMNAIDYNAELDHIMLSIPTFDELWIIDHSTTSLQASGHFGGFLNHGGDLAYRFGNAFAYQRGTEEDKLLHYQHDTHWATDFLNPSNENYGKVVVFNNRKGSDYSTVELFDTSWEMYIGDYEKFNGTWPPYEFDRTIKHPIDSTKMYSTGLSSAQVLDNGNILICSGREGYIFEITPNNKIVWEYKVPLKMGSPVSVETELSQNDNLTFRAFKYPADYEAFIGKDLSSKKYLELNPDSLACSKFLSVSVIEDSKFKLFPNPASNMIKFTWNSGKMIEGDIVDIAGRKHLNFKGNGGMTYIDVTSLQSGLYLIRVEGEQVGKFIVNR